MNENKRLPEKFFDVLEHEGVVTVMSWGVEPHIVNTWNNVNNKIKLALGSREVLGYKDYQGTGFIVTGTARYISSGDEYEYMKKKFPFLTRVFEVTVDKATQML